MNLDNIVLAAADLSRSVSDYSSRSKTLSGNFYLLLIIATIALFCVGLYFREKIIRLFYPERTPSELVFDELCTYHRLNRSERKWLQQLGELNGADHEAMVFVTPGWFSVNSKMPGGSLKTGKKLLAKLFGKKWVIAQKAS